MPRVKLQTAFWWSCPECCHENYDKPAKAEMTEEDLETAYRRLYQLDPWESLPEGWETTQFVTVPAEVVCENCLEEHSTYDELEEDI